MGKNISLTLILLPLLLAPCWAAGSASPDQATLNTFLFSAVSEPIAASASAQVVSFIDEDIGSLIDGEIQNLLVTEGQKVKKNELLIEFRCDAYILSLKRQEINLRRARLKEKIASEDFRRNKALFLEKTVSNTNFQKTIDALELASIEVMQSEVSISLAQYNESNCRVLAPFDGQVTHIYSGKGGYVTAGTSLLHLLQTDRLEVIAELSKEELEQARNSAELIFVADEISSPVLIRAVNEQQDIKTGRQRVHLTMQKSQPIVAGMVGSVQWISEQRRIPPQYLLRRQQSLGILLMKGGQMKFEPIPGAIYGLPVNIELPFNTEVVLP